MADLLPIHYISVYVERLYRENQRPALLYHNLEHTKMVIRRAREIAANYSFDEKEMFILLTAAWFHDTGHLFVEARYHEAKSVSIMRTCLETKEVDTNVTDAVEGCILATRLPQCPTTLLEEILCDADTFNLGTKEFFDTDRSLKKEVELRNDTRIDNWQKTTLKLLAKHRYFTPYCQALLNKGKLENIEIVRSLLK